MSAELSGIHQLSTDIYWLCLIPGVLQARCVLGYRTSTRTWYRNPKAQPSQDILYRSHQFFPIFAGQAWCIQKLESWSSLVQYPWDKQLTQGPTVQCYAGYQVGHAKCLGKHVKTIQNQHPVRQISTWQGTAVNQLWAEVWCSSTQHTALNSDSRWNMAGMQNKYDTYWYLI